MNEMMRDPTEMSVADADIDKVYSALGKSTEYWAVVGRGAFAFRFGPYTAEEIGPILTKSVEDRIVVNVVGVCGREFDWNTATDLGLKMVLEGDPGWVPAKKAAPKREGDAMWGWIAGIAVLILIAFVLIGGWNGGG